LLAIKENLPKFGIRGLTFPRLSGISGKIGYQIHQKMPFLIAYSSPSIFAVLKIFLLCQSLFIKSTETEID